MAKKALEQIMHAEAEAEKIRSDALEKADGIRSDAHRKGKELRAEEATKSRTEKKQVREDAELAAQQIVKKANQDAVQEAEVLSRAAEDQLPRATALILERIRMLWQ